MMLLLKIGTSFYLEGELVMNMDILLKIRKMGIEIKRKRQNEEVDFEYMTAPCGLPCFKCYLYAKTELEYPVL